MDFRWVFESIGGHENEMIFGPSMVHSQFIVVRLPIFMGLLMDRIKYGPGVVLAPSSSRPIEELGQGPSQDVSSRPTACRLRAPYLNKIFKIYLVLVWCGPKF